MIEVINVSPGGIPGAVGTIGVVLVIMGIFGIIMSLNSGVRFASYEQGVKTIFGSVILSGIGSILLLVVWLTGVR